MPKRKLEADAKLIQVLFDVDPHDWCRYDDGTLVFLNQAGQKFVYSAEALDILSDKKLSQPLAGARGVDPRNAAVSTASVKGITKLKSDPKNGLNDSHETLDEPKPIG